MVVYYRGFHIEAKYHKSWFGRERLYYSVVADGDGWIRALSAGYVDKDQDPDRASIHALVESLKARVDDYLAGMASETPVPKVAV
jgi:hypothetical protein